MQINQFAAAAAVSLASREINLIFPPGLDGLAMQVLATLLFALFSTTTTTSEVLSEFRVQNPPDSDAIRLLTRNTKHVINSHVCHAGHAEPAGGELDDIVDDLHRKMDDSLPDLQQIVGDFIARALALYGRQLLKLMFTFETLIDSDRVRLDRNVLCAVSFLFHYRADGVGAAFRLSLVLHLLPAEFAYPFLAKELNSFIESGRRESAAENSTATGGGDAGRTKRAVDPFRQLQQIRDLIKAVSDPFCEPSVTQILVDDAHFIDKLNKQESNFITYMYQNEMFAVTFTTNESNQDVISSWDTSGVSKSLEYGIEDYFKRIQKNDEASKSRLVRPADLADAGGLVNVESLKKRLSSENTFYFNLVKYSDILLEVALLVSVKEGNKLLQAAKDLMSRRCIEHRRNKITLAEVNTVRTSLEDLIETFQKLATKIDRSIRPSVYTKSKKSQFEKNVNFICNVFNVSTVDLSKADEFIDDICNDHEAFIKLNYIDDAVHSDKHDSDFKEYYLNKPLLNVESLYEFINGLF